MEAFVTLATNDHYALGAMVWAASLRLTNTEKKIVILITEGVSQNIRDVLPQFFDEFQIVDLLKSTDAAILEALKRPELNVTLTKIHCWKLEQYKKCVFMDADTLVIKNIDELFEREELSAVPDIGWPDCFNTGVFVFKPSLQTFNELVQLAAKEGSFDGGDQGLLNTYFADWATTDIKRHLSFIYNMTLASTYSYLPAYKKFGANVKVIHFLGSLKPWNCSFNFSTMKLNNFSGNDFVRDLIEKWWHIMANKVHPMVENIKLNNSLANLMINSCSSTNKNDLENRYQAWQEGTIDYLGQDSFTNIQKQLDASIHGK